MDDQTIRNKIKQTCRERYGVDNVFQSQTIKDKIANIHVKKRGVSHPSQSADVKEKKRQRCLDNYGVDNPMKCPEIAKKAQDTCASRYGTANAFASDEIKHKIRNTNQQKYGVDNPSQCPAIQEKRKQTFLDKYGVENPFLSETIRESIRQSNIQKYGSPYPPNVHYTENAIREWLLSCGFEFNTTWNVLGNKQIDLYSDINRLGIEYCGLYWHTELSPTGRNRNYHYDKYLRCQQQGIRLITLFSDEWLNRQTQCKNRILTILGNTVKVYARKCNLNTLTKQECIKFMEENHIQGATNQTLVCFGLWYEGNLVAALSLGRHPRRTQSLLLDRLCFIDNVRVIGGASKLLKPSIAWAKDHGYNAIRSFSDNRWSQGRIYESLGFTLEKDIKPDYSYVNLRRPDRRISKQSQQKRKTGCPNGLTEKEWSEQHGLSRIWDCGKKLWRLDI